MEKSKAIAGYSHNGLPYNRVGRGPRTLVLFQGLLQVENKPLPASMTWLYSKYYQYLEEDFTTYIVLRKPGMPVGYSMQDMADDYATMIQEAFGGPVDIMGVSTGGSIAHHFAADHPELVRKLIIHSSAYTLSDLTKNAQMQAGQLARQRRWKAAYAAMFRPAGYSKPVLWLVSLMAGVLAASHDPSDFVVTIEAEDKFNFKDRLGQITASTLVVGGDKDPFYTEALFRETAEGIPNARLILYKGVGHPAGGEQFRRDVLTFLKEGNDASDHDH